MPPDTLTRTHAITDDTIRRWAYALAPGASEDQRSAHIAAIATAIERTDSTDPRLLFAAARRAVRPWSRGVLSEVMSPASRSHRDALIDNSDNDNLETPTGLGTYGQLQRQRHFEGDVDPF